MKEPPFWWPETRGFIATAIILIVGYIVVVLMTNAPDLDERATGVALTIIGVLLASFKDVISYYFGSSAESKAKTEVISQSNKTQAETIQKLTNGHKPEEAPKQ